MQHALASLIEIENISATRDLTAEKINYWFTEAVNIASSIAERIASTRKKNHTNTFRKMVNNSEAEMNNVLVKFDSNSFVQQQEKGRHIFCPKAPAKL